MLAQAHGLIHFHIVSAPIESISLQLSCFQVHLLGTSQRLILGSALEEVMSDIAKGLAFILLQLKSVMEGSLVAASICHDSGSGLFGSLI